MYEIRQLWVAFVLARHVACRLPILVRALTLHRGPVGFDPAFHADWVHFRMLRYHLALCAGEFVWKMLVVLCRRASMLLRVISAGLGIWLLAAGIAVDFFCSLEYLGLSSKFAVVSGMHGRRARGVAAAQPCHPEW